MEDCEGFQGIGIIGNERLVIKRHNCAEEKERELDPLLARARSGACRPVPIRRLLCNIYGRISIRPNGQVMSCSPDRGPLPDRATTTWTRVLLSLFSVFLLILGKTIYIKSLVHCKTSYYLILNTFYLST